MHADYMHAKGDVAVVAASAGVAAPYAAGMWQYFGGNCTIPGKGHCRHDDEAKAAMRISQT
jgi:hypothetical protein